MFFKFFYTQLTSIKSIFKLNRLTYWSHLALLILVRELLITPITEMHPQTYKYCETQCAIFSVRSALNSKLCVQRGFPGKPVAGTLLSLQGTRLQSLAGELRPHMLCGVAKKLTNQQKSRVQQDLPLSKEGNPKLALSLKFFN